VPTFKTSGIVLRRMNLGEADRIITFITPDRGKIKAVARGVRRIKSRMAGHLELFGQVNLMLAQGRSLDVIASAQVQRPMVQIADDMERLTLAYTLAEMADKLLPEGGGHTGVYHLLAECYTELAAREADPLVELYFKLRLLAELGYAPGLEACAVCHRTAGEQYFFSPERGGIVDAACRQSLGTAMTQNQIKLWRLALRHPLSALRGVGGATDEARASLPIADQFYDHTFGLRFQTGRMLKTL
jgi:DNA repair protein RecO (recombination protein O)